VTGAFPHSESISWVRVNVLSLQALRGWCHATVVVQMHNRFETYSGAALVLAPPLAR